MNVKQTLWRRAEDATPAVWEDISAAADSVVRETAVPAGTPKRRMWAAAVSGVAAVAVAAAVLWAAIPHGGGVGGVTPVTGGGTAATGGSTAPTSGGADARALPAVRELTAESFEAAFKLSAPTGGGQTWTYGTTGGDTPVGYIAATDGEREVAMYLISVEDYLNENNEEIMAQDGKSIVLYFCPEEGNMPLNIPFWLINGDKNFTLDGKDMVSASCFISTPTGSYLLAAASADYDRDEMNVFLDEYFKDDGDNFIVMGYSWIKEDDGSTVGGYYLMLHNKYLAGVEYSKDSADDE